LHELAGYRPGFVELNEAHFHPEVLSLPLSVILLNIAALAKGGESWLAESD
jgi:hypothetical protein